VSEPAPVDGRARRQLAGFMVRERSTGLLGGPGGLQRLLAGRTTPLMRVTGWLIATAIFATSLIVWYGIGHGPTGPVTPNGDSQESAVPAVAIEHGAFSCAYPETNRSSVPPLYPLLAGGTLAATGSRFIVGPWVRTGASCPELSADRIGPGYPQWSFLLTGLICWPFLLAGFVLLVEVAGRGHTRLEVLGTWLLGLLPAITSAYVDEFHPEDLLALGFILLGIALAARQRWLGTGVCIGLALCSKQYAALAAVPLFICAPGWRRLRYAAAALGTAAVVLVPLGLLMGRGMLDALIGRYATSSDGATLIGQLHLHGAPLVAVSRVLPLVLGGAVALIARARLGEAVCRPLPLTALLAVSMILRLVFEINLYSYYFIAATVCVLAVDLVAGRLRAATVAWLLVTGVLYPPVYETLVPLQEHAPLVAQGADLLTALALAVRPLVSLGATRAAVRRVPQMAGADG
jgi:hypothetical protein